MSVNDCFALLTASMMTLALLGPFEGFGTMCIMHFVEPLNFVAKLFDAGENTPVNRPPFQLGKPPFHGIEPRSAGGVEM